jgi:hypothetical protein
MRLIAVILDQYSVFYFENQHCFSPLINPLYQRLPLLATKNAINRRFYDVFGDFLTQGGNMLK